jgi:hypothetical protein
VERLAVTHAVDDPAPDPDDPHFHGLGHQALRAVDHPGSVPRPMRIAMSRARRRRA